jgi:hypothetical protein
LGNEKEEVSAKKNDDQQIRIESHDLINSIQMQSFPVLVNE